MIKVSGVSLLGLDKRIVEMDKCWKRSAERKSKVLKVRKRTLCKVRDWRISQGKVLGKAWDQNDETW